jgi:hypothetical protein
MAFASEVYLNAHPRSADLAELSVGEHIVNPPEEILLVVGLGQIVVRSRIEPPNNV